MENKEKNRKVSIIIPVFNVEKYLENCMQSVLEQTYTDFEVILVDDGSTDSSDELCDRYALCDERVKVIHQANGGLSHARNVGVQHANGEYLFFLDSDDCIHPELLERTVRLAEEYQVSIVQIDIQEVPNDFYDYHMSLEKDYPLYHFSSVEAFYNLEKDNKALSKDIRLTTSVAWTKLYKRELAKKISFPENIRLHEDQMVAHRFIVEAGSVLFYSAPLYFYRKRPNSLITEGWTTKRLTMIECYEDRLFWAKKLNVEANEKEKLTNYVFERYLTCMFKNYWMATLKLSGNEKLECQSFIIKKYRQAIKNKEYSLQKKQWIIYHAFAYFPKVFTFIYGIMK